MFDKLKQLGKLAQLRSQAKSIAQSLAKEEIEIEQGRVKVIISANQELREVFIDGETQPFLVKVINEAIKKSQKVAAKKMQGLAGDLLGF